MRPAAQQRSSKKVQRKQTDRSFSRLSAAGSVDTLTFYQSVGAAIIGAVCAPADRLSRERSPAVTRSLDQQVPKLPVLPRAAGHCRAPGRRFAGQRAVLVSGGGTRVPRCRTRR